MQGQLVLSDYAFMNSIRGKFPLKILLSNTQGLSSSNQRDMCGAIRSTKKEIGCSLCLYECDLHISILRFYGRVTFLDMFGTLVDWLIHQQ